MSCSCTPSPTRGSELAFTFSRSRGCSLRGSRLSVANIVAPIDAAQQPHDRQSRPSHLICKRGLLAVACAVCRLLLTGGPAPPRRREAAISIFRGGLGEGAGGGW
eukprot:scaffold18928_cov69-Phaeocystis_antarctica.AAC.2